MVKRTITSAAGIALLVLIFWTCERAPFVLNLVISLVAVLAVVEFLTAAGQKKRMGILISSGLYALLMPLVPLLETGAKIDSALSACVILTLFYAFFLFVYMILYHGSIQYHELASTLLFVLLIASSLTALPVVYSMGTWMHNSGTFYVVVLLVAAWAADIGAYLVGTFFGKHKLIPEVSPKKTVEGLIGGVVFNIACMLLMAWLYDALYANAGEQVRYPVFALAGLVGALISTIGDLTFSLVKRHHGVKDYGKIMPGHGGILDRIDSLVFVIPAVYVLFLFFPPVVG